MQDKTFIMFLYLLRYVLPMLERMDIENVVLGSLSSNWIIKVILAIALITLGNEPF